jgi:hypothetical protein
MSDDCFTVDVCLPESWLVAALERAKAGKSVRVTFVVKDSGPKAKTKVGMRPDRTDDSLQACMAGDLTLEPFWSE